MALEATHLRFALELQNEYGVKDIGEYILGTSYPDSRYISGISRESTHGDFVLTKEFANKSDFNKGWQVHQICDIVQYKAFRKQIPLLDKFGDDWVDSDKWITFTAAKIIQDMSDRKLFDIDNYLPYLKIAKNPNGEDVNKVIRYYDILINEYSRESTPEIYCDTLCACGVEKELVVKTKEKVDVLMNDNIFIEQIKTVFSEMLITSKSVLFK